MSARPWLTSAAVAAGLLLGLAPPGGAADPRADYTFGSLKAATPEAGRAQAEAWLKKVGKFDQAAFEKIWAEDVSVLDRTIASLELGSDDARKIMAAARNSAVEAPKEVPALLKDEKQDPYLRANLALGFGRALTTGRVYEESLAALSGVKAEQTVDPAAYFFHRAVAEHALMRKDDAMRSIVRLLDDVSGAPDRYTMLGRILFVEMATWTKDEKDLANIRRLMDNSERRLGQARGGKTTQTIQKKIVFRLDELIKEKENQAKGGA